MYEQKLHTMALVWGPHRNNPRLLSVLFCLGVETGKDSALATHKRKASQDGVGHFIAILKSLKSSASPQQKELIKKLLLLLHFSPTGSSILAQDLSEHSTIHFEHCGLSAEWQGGHWALRTVPLTCHQQYINRRGLGTVL